MKNLKCHAMTIADMMINEFNEKMEIKYVLNEINNGLFWRIKLYCLFMILTQQQAKSNTEHGHILC